MPLGLFGSRAFVGLTLLTFLLYGALGGLMLLLPYTLIEARRLSRGQGRLGAAALADHHRRAARRLMGKLAARIGPRWPLTLGPLLVAGGFRSASGSTPSSDYWTTVLPSILAISAGMAIAVAPLTTAVLGSVDAASCRHRLRPQQRGLAQRRPDRHRPARHGAARRARR